MDNQKKARKIKAVGPDTVDKAAPDFDKAAAEASPPKDTRGPDGDFPAPFLTAVQEEKTSWSDEKGSQSVLTSEGVLLQIERLKMLIESLEADLQFRFPVAEKEKRLPKARQEAQRCRGLLIRVETALTKQLQRFGKRLDRAGCLLAGLREQGLEEIKEKLKKARKDLEKILPD